MTRVALVGAGVVGSSWSLVFARAGFEVAIYEADPAIRSTRRISYRSSKSFLPPGRTRKRSRGRRS